jgi:hypothetical protein
VFVRGAERRSVLVVGDPKLGEEEKVIGVHVFALLYSSAVFFRDETRRSFLAPLPSSTF